MTGKIIVLIKILLLSSFTIFCLNKNFKDLVTKEEFRVWVLTFFSLTSVAFLAPNLLIMYGLFMVLAWLYSKKVESNIALYFAVLLVLPTYPLQTVLINLTYHNAISLSLLLPLFLKSGSSEKIHKTNIVDYIFYMYLCLVFVLQFRGISHANYQGYFLTYPAVIKYGFDIALQVFLPYFLITRYIKTFDQLKLIIVAFVTAGVIVSTLAIYEIGSGKSLYAIIPSTLGLDSGFKGVLRDNLLRAEASVEHPITLGAILVIVLGLYNYLSIYMTEQKYKMMGYLLIVGGLVGTLSRGPWIGATLCMVIFYLFQRQKLKKAFWLLIGFLAALLVINISGYMDKVLKLLPFVGDNVDVENIDYRYLLLKQSLVVIADKPWFGMYDPRTHEAMVPLIQGQGIIDLVNIYLSVAMSYGLVGFALYMMFIIIVILKLLRVLLFYQDKKDELYKCGLSLLASLLGFMVVMSAISNTSILNSIFFTLAALIIAFLNISKAKKKDRIVNTFKLPSDRIIKA